MAGAGGILCYNPRHARGIHLANSLRRRHIAGRGLHPGYADVNAYLNYRRCYTDPYGLLGRHTNAHRNPYSHRHRDAYPHRDRNPHIDRHSDAVPDTGAARGRWPGG